MLQFTSKNDQELSKIIANKEQLFNLIHSYGKLLNILLPHRLDENIEAFLKVFKKHQLNGEIYFAHKANKSTSILRRAKYNKIKIDVASVAELEHALKNGFTGQEIEITGPKNQDLILLGLMHDALFNVDNFDELDQIQFFSKQLSKSTKTRILIRLNSFTNPRKNVIPKPSRFGISIKNYQSIIKKFKDNPHFQLLGLSFHLDTTDPEEKISAIAEILTILPDFFASNLPISILNIGGGFKLNYLASKTEWDNSISTLREDFLSNNSPTWDGNKFGLKVENGKLHGQLNLYDYYNLNSKEKYLDYILSAKLPDFESRTVAEILAENEITLMIEPGRSLLDNLGFTLAQINFIKDSSLPEKLIGVNMNRSNLSLSGQEILIDPILIGNGKKQSANYFIIGNLCMENDLIFSRKIHFKTQPSTGDLLLFPNTAGYLMDFNESQPILQPTGLKIVLNKNHQPILDSNYHPYQNHNLIGA